MPNADDSRFLFVSRVRLRKLGGDDGTVHIISFFFCFAGISTSGFLGLTIPGQIAIFAAGIRKSEI